MKKALLIVSLSTVLVVSLFFGARALAANLGGRDTTQVESPDGNNPGCMGGSGVTGSYISPEMKRIATFLGLTPEVLQTQLQSGQTLAQIAQSKNVTRQALLDAVMAPTKDMVQLRVKYGYLTQAQADSALQQELTQANTLIDRVSSAPANPQQGSVPGTGRGYGGMMGGGSGSGRGGMMGGGFGSGGGGAGMMGGGFGSSGGGAGMMGGYTW